MTSLERVGVAPIVEKLVENRLRWFRHVERRLIDVVVRRVDQIEDSHVKRGRGGPKKTIRETIRKDLEVNELDSNLVYDRTLWRIVSQIRAEQGHIWINNLYRSV